MTVDPFDFGSDPCHLAWVIRDNPRLLNHLAAFCSDSTPFHILVNSSAFSRCDGMTTVKPSRNNGSEQPNTFHNISKSMVITLILMLLQDENAFL